MVSERPRNLFTVCPDEPTSVAPVRRKPTRTVDPRGEYKICKASSYEVVRVCVGQITLTDLHKAAKCAKIKGDFKVYRNKSFSKQNSLTQDDFPYKGDIYISKAFNVSESVTTSSSRTRTKIFSVCPEGPTSNVPVRRSIGTTAPAPDTSSVRKQLLQKALASFQAGISALEALTDKL